MSRRRQTLSRARAAIVTVMLEEWVRAAGYLRSTDAVEATVAAAIAATNV